MASHEAFGDRMLRGMLLVALCVACLWVLAPFLGLIAWAGILAMVLAPGFDRIERRLGGRHWLTLVIVGAVLIAAVVVPVLQLAAASVDGVDWLRGLVANPPELPVAPDWLAGMPAGHWLVDKWELVRGDLDAAVTELMPMLRDVGVWLLQFAALAGFTLLEFIAAMLIALLMLHRQQAVEAYVARIAVRVSGAEGVELVGVVVRTVRSVFLGIVGTALVQGLLVALGLWVAGVPGAGVLGFVAFVAAVAQLPTLLIWAPAAIWLGSDGSMVAAVGLALWGLVVVNTVDNVLKPMIISSGAQLPLLLIFIGVIGGLLQFGFLGLFIGPVLLGVVHTLFVHWVDVRTPG